ncbi:MAG: pseudaminic acid synthase [Pseudodesulfovibrio sp.]
MRIGNREIGPGRHTYVIAEMSGNHQQDYDKAVAIIHAAKAAGADAVKIQTYTADTITLDSDKECFQVRDPNWVGFTMHQVFRRAYTPWEWQPRLKEVANGLGLDFFSTPFDFTAVDFLEEMGVPCYKIASFELVDIPLIRKVAATGKPLILSTGMGSEAEIREAVDAFRKAGGTDLALLKCTSAYPAPPEEINLNTMIYMREAFGVDVGLSDHSLGVEVPIAAAAVGASVVEKHLCLDRSEEGPDSYFSLEPDEFRAMVDGIRKVEAAMGVVTFAVTSKQQACLISRRSLFVVRDIRAGERFTPENVRSIRPGHGLHTRHYDEVLGRSAACDIRCGTPLEWAHVAGDEKMGEDGC